MSFRLFHDLERRYLATETLGLVCRYLETEEYPPHVVECAIDESVRLGKAGRLCVTPDLFCAVLEALWEEGVLPLPGIESSFCADQSARWTC